MNDGDNRDGRGGARPFCMRRGKDFFDTLRGGAPYVHRPSFGEILVFARRQNTHRAVKQVPLGASPSIR